MLLIVCPLAFLAGFIDSVAGGGGLISLPAYLAAGLPPQLAAGTNKFSASFGTTLATFQYARAKRIAWRPALLGAAGALPGAYLGAQLLMHMPADIMRWLLIAVVPVVAFVVLRNRDNREEDENNARGRDWIALPIGLVIGAYDGFFGPGTGTFLALLFNVALKLPWVKASASAKPINLASNVASLLAFIQSGQVLFLLGIPAALCSIAGNFLGSRAAIKKGAPVVRGMLIVALILLLARILWDLVAAK